MSGTSNTEVLLEVAEARERGEVQVVIEALAHTDREVRWVAANSLRELRSPIAVQPLKRLASSATDESLRILALKGLAAIRDPAVAPALVEIARDADSIAVRSTAISALADLQDERAVPLLVEIVADQTLQARAGRWHARSAVRWALGRLVDLQAFEAVPELERASMHLGLMGRRDARRAIRMLRRAGASEKSRPRAGTPADRHSP